MEQYHNLLKLALSGERRENERTGAGTLASFQRQERWDLNDGFPIVTTKPVNFDHIAHELLWFLRGEVNIRPLLENHVPIWTSDCLRHNLDYVLDSGLMTKQEVEYAQDLSKKAREGDPSGDYRPGRELIKRFADKILEDEDFANVAGDMGPIYGAQWRGTNGATSIDQVLKLEELLSQDPGSRYQIVDAWNPVDKGIQALPACHMLYQAHVGGESDKLTLGWYQRSADSVLGVPYNISSYALLANLVAHTHDKKLGELVGTFADLHVYLPHIDAAEEQLERKPLPLPELKIHNKRSSITEYERDDFELVGYKHHPKLSTPTPMFGGFL